MPTLTALAARPEPETDNRAVIATDFAGVIRHLTPAAELLLGHYDLVGRSLRSLHVEEELQARATEIGMVGLDELEAVFARLRSGQVACERQRWTYLCADSARIRVNTTVTRVYGGVDDVVAFAIVLETPQVVIWPAPSLHRRAPLVQFGDDYSSSMSHELRTPMAVILGYTELLQSLDAGPLPESQHTMLGHVERNAHRVLEMINSILHSYPAGPRDPSFAPGGR